MNVLSLFDGISCGQIALERAGIKVDKYYASEIEETAIQVTQHHYPDTIQLGNIFDLNFEELKKINIDMIIGGSPCTFWSISRRDRETTCEGFGFELFSKYEEAIKIINPKYFLYENNYKIADDITNEITKRLGVSPRIVNSSLLSGQQRYRQYWTNIDFYYPQDKGICVNDLIDVNEEEEDLMYCSNIRKENNYYSSKCVRIGEIGKGGQGERIYSPYGKSVTLTANGGGRGAKTGLYLIGNKVRKLSCLEAERLQTLPDNYTSIIKSKTDRYKAIGNGWTVNVIAHIFSFLPDEYKIKE